MVQIMTALLPSYLNSAWATGLAAVLLWEIEAEEQREREKKIWSDRAAERQKQMSGEKQRNENAEELH